MIISSMYNEKRQTVSLGYAKCPQVGVIHLILANWNLNISIRNNVILFTSQLLKMKLSPPQTQQKIQSAETDLQGYLLFQNKRQMSS